MKTKVALSEQELRSLIRDVLIEAPVPEGAGDDFDSLVTPETKAHLDKMISYLGKFIVPQGDAGSGRFRSKLSVYIMNSPPHYCQSQNTEMESGEKFISYGVSQAISTDAGPDALLINLFNFIACAFALGKSVTVHTSRGPKVLKPACSLYSLAIGGDAYIGTMDPSVVETYKSPGIDFTIHDLKTVEGQTAYIQNVITKDDVLQSVAQGIKQVESAAKRTLPMLDYYDEAAKAKVKGLLVAQVAAVNAKIKENINSYNTAQLQYYLYEPLVRPSQWISNPDLQDPASSPWWTAWEACNIFARSIDAIKDGLGQNAACAAMVMHAARQMKKGVAFRASEGGWSSELQGGAYQTLLEEKSGRNLRVFLTEAQLKRLIYAALSLNEVDRTKIVTGAQKVLSTAGDVGVPGAGLAAKALGAIAGEAEPVAAAAGAAARSAPDLAGAASTLRAGANLEQVQLPQAVAKIINRTTDAADSERYIQSIGVRISTTIIDSLRENPAAVGVFADNIADSVSKSARRIAKSRNFSDEKADAIEKFCRAAVKYSVELSFGITDSKAELDAARKELQNIDSNSSIEIFLGETKNLDEIYDAASRESVLTADAINDAIAVVDPSLASSAKANLDSSIIPLLRRRKIELTTDGDIVVTVSTANAGTRRYKPAAILAAVRSYKSALENKQPIAQASSEARGGRDFVLMMTGKDDIETVNSQIDLLTEVVDYVTQGAVLGAESTKSTLRAEMDELLRPVVNYIRSALSETQAQRVTKQLTAEPGEGAAQTLGDYISAAVGGSSASTASFYNIADTADKILKDWKRPGGMSKVSAIWKTASLLLFTAPKLRADIGRGLIAGPGWLLEFFGSTEWGPALVKAGGFDKYIGPRIVGDIAVFAILWPLLTEHVLKNDPVAKTLFADILVRGGWTQFGGIGRLAVDAANEIGRDMVDAEVQEYMKLVSDGNSPKVMRGLFQNLMKNQLAQVSDADLVQIFRLAGPDQNLVKFGPIAEFLLKRINSLGGEFGDTLSLITPETPELSQENVSSLLIDVGVAAKEITQLKQELARFGSGVQGNETLTSLKAGRVAVISQVLRLLDNMEPGAMSINPVNASSTIAGIKKYETVLTSDYRRDLEASPTGALFDWFDLINPDNLFYLPVYLKNTFYPIEVSTPDDPTTLTKLGASVLYNGPGRRQDLGEIDDLDPGLVQDIGKLVDEMGKAFGDIYAANMVINPPAATEQK